MEFSLPAATASPTRTLPVFLAFARMSINYFRRNGISLAMTLAVPIMFLVLYSYSYYLSTPAFRLKVGISASMPQAYATTLREALGDELFTLTTIPESAAANSINEGKSRLVVTMDTRSGLPVVHAAKYDRPLADLLLQVLIGKRDDVSEALRKQHFRLIEQGNSPMFFLPSIILMSLLNLGLFTTGAKILQERSSGTLRLYRMLPAPVWTYFAAELVTKLLLASLLIAVFLVAAGVLFDIQFSWLLSAKVMAAGLICATAFIALGIALGSSLNRYSSGMHVFTLVNLLVVLLGDLFFSASRFSLTKLIALCLPTTYGADILKSVLLDIPNRFPYWASLGFLVAFSVIAFTVAAINFRFTAEE